MTIAHNQESIFKAPATFVAGALVRGNVSEWLQSTMPEAAVSLDLIDGIFSVHKFGSIRNVDNNDTPATVWEGGGTFSGGSDLYPWQDAPYALEVLSDDAEDTVAGTGARRVRIQGLDENFELAEELVELNGTTEVSTTRTNWRRVFRVFVCCAGSGNVNAGNIIVRIPTADTIQAVVIAGRGQSLQAAYTIPAGHTGVLTDWAAAVLESGTNNELELALVSRVQGESFRQRSISGVRGSGSTTFEKVFRSPIVLQEKTDVEIRLITEEPSNNDMSASFDLLVIRNDLLIPGESQ
jgi:hypothetical protein